MNTPSKILLILASVLLLGVGGFSLYKFITKEKVSPNKETAQNLIPTETPAIFNEVTSTPPPNPTVSPFPTTTSSPTETPKKLALIPTVSQTPSVYQTPSVTPSSTPTPKATTTPTQALSPTVRVTPTITPTPMPALPQSGNPWPTYLLLSLGSLSIIAAIFLF